MADEERTIQPGTVPGVKRTRVIRDPKYGHEVEVHELLTSPAPAPAPAPAPPPYTPPRRPQ